MLNGRLLVAGGFDASSHPLSDVEIYDPTSDTWSAAAPMRTARSDHTATLLNNGKVLVTGGWGSSAGSRELASAEIYDPAANSWQSVPPMSDPRALHTATLLNDGRVLVVGGPLMAPGNASAEIYDPATNSWMPAASAIVPHRAGHTATLLQDGRVLVVGGSNGQQVGYLNDAEIYDPRLNSWSAGHTIFQHAQHTATRLLDGRVLIVGGFAKNPDGAGGYISSPAAEIFDPQLNSWAVVASLRIGRNSHSATLLPDGSVLAIGGQTGAAMTGTAERFYPTLNVWRMAPTLLQPRAAHTTTLTLSERLIVIGGTTGGSSAIAEAEALS